MNLHHIGESIGSKVNTGFKSAKRHSPHSKKAWLVIALIVLSLIHISEPTRLL